MNDLGDRLPMEALDPGTSDPRFWARFHVRVMEQAQAELGRRQAYMRLTVPEVVFSWRRTLVPTALMAAALAGILLLGQGEASVPLSPLALEEALTQDLVVEPIPSILGRGDELDEPAFLHLVGGF
jgi:hypothetical protein